MNSKNIEFTHNVHTLCTLSLHYRYVFILDPPPWPSPSPPPFYRWKKHRATCIACAVAELEMLLTWRQSKTTISLRSTKWRNIFWQNNEKNGKCHAVNDCNSHSHTSHTDWVYLASNTYILNDRNYQAKWNGSYATETTNRTKKNHNYDGDKLLFWAKCFFRSSPQSGDKTDEKRPTNE